MTRPEDQLEAPRPSFLGIHSRDMETQILYISSGCREAIGFTPAQMLANQAKGYIYDSFNSAYPTIYQDKAKENEFEDEEGNDDESNAFCIYMNLRTASGLAVFHKVVTMRADNCVVVVATAFPERPFQDLRELQVQTLDGKLQKMTIDSSTSAVQRGTHQSAAIQGGRAPLYFSRSRQIKAVLVLEHPEAVEIDTEETGRRPTGPLVVFCTSSISRLVDVDNSDIMNYPFMKLVSPEDLLHVSKFFEKLSQSSEVLFETFSLLQRPNVIEGDIFVSDEENQRVVVEALGANVQDGIAILVRKLKVVPPPKRDTMGNYIHSRMHEMTEDNGYQSLCEFISSDANTSEAEGWAQLR
ncbi:hypothetical protein GGH12_003402 [Coemansia sp. RSA 1822]|nr:hypothetical protein IW147_002919 [Coemansia sp. RSA 720]KAJ2542112.1 hypothetical protein GGF49_003120 [Coemansia sp. RSA 1853]KAJ2562218.1 hypothetical protein GGH12_003402 [Coemansia sp. RSA 1822]